MHTDSVHFVGKGQIGKVQPGNCTVAPARHRSAYPYSSQQKPRNMACQHPQTHARGEGQLQSLLQLEVRVKGLTTMLRKHKFALDHAPSVHAQHG